LMLPPAHLDKDEREIVRRHLDKLE